MVEFYSVTLRKFPLLNFMQIFTTFYFFFIFGSCLLAENLAIT